MAPKKNKESGNKKIFSVPVGKLRSKTCRSGSFSRKASKSKLYYSTVMENNRKLAYALSKQKEMTKELIDDKLKLTSSLHESKLQLIGLEKKFEECTNSFTNYRKCIKSYIKNAVNHSVLLTEDLKLMMEVTYNDPDQGIVKEVKDDLPPKKVLPISTQKQRVNPMIGGYTIRYPIINLQRVNMQLNEKETDTNFTETVDSITENVPEISSVRNSVPSPHMDLSTCYEEVENASDENICSTSVEEEHEDSIRRKTVSFRNRVIDKDKQQWRTEDPNDASMEDATLDQEEINNKIHQVNGLITNNSEQPMTSRKSEYTSLSESLFKRTPVVALNDVSRYLQKSNSVNILQISMDNHKAVKVASGTPNAPESERENLPINKIMQRSSQASFSGEEKDANIEKSKECPLSCNNNKPTVDEDPLEGSSWMYSKLFENNAKKSARGRSKSNLKSRVTKTKKALKNTSTANNQREKVECLFTPDFDRKKNVSNEDDDACNTNVDNSSSRKKLNVSNVSDVQNQDPKDCSMNQLQIGSSNYSKLCDESLRHSFKDMCDISEVLHSKHALHSTPVEKKSVNSGTQLSSTKDFLDESTNQGRLSDPSESSSSQESSKISGKDCVVKESINTKLLGFVTVRVKKLDYRENNLMEDSPVSGDDTEELQTTADDSVISDSSNVFLGFSDTETSSEYAAAKKNGLNFLRKEEIISAVYSGTLEDTNGSESSLGDELITGGSSRPRRKAAPRDLKEPNIWKKLRRDTLGSKRKGKK